MKPSVIQADGQLKNKMTLLKVATKNNQADTPLRTILHVLRHRRDHAISDPTNLPTPRGPRRPRFYW